MWTIFGILKPGTGPERDALGPLSVRQKPFFSRFEDEDEPIPDSERDAAVLTDKAPLSTHRAPDDDEHLRFVTLFAPPYF